VDPIVKKIEVMFGVLISIVRKYDLFRLCWL